MPCKRDRAAWLADNDRYLHVVSAGYGRRDGCMQIISSCQTELDQKPEKAHSEAEGLFGELCRWGALLLYYVRTQLTYTYVESVWYFRLVGFQGDCIGMILIYGDKWASTTYNSGTRVWKSTRT